MAPSAHAKSLRSMGGSPSRNVIGSGRAWRCSTLRNMPPGSTAPGSIPSRARCVASTAARSKYPDQLLAQVGSLQHADERLGRVLEALGHGLLVLDLALRDQFAKL